MKTAGPNATTRLPLITQGLGLLLMFGSYYGLSFNSFDKHNLREGDRFFDISEMMNRLDYLK